MSFHPSIGPQLCNWLPTNQGHYMVPHYLMQFVFLGTAVLVAILVIGFLVILDRVRLPVITRARQSNESYIQNLVMRALSQYEDLNNS